MLETVNAMHKYASPGTIRGSTGQVLSTTASWLATVHPWAYRTYVEAGLFVLVAPRIEIVADLRRSSVILDATSIDPSCVDLFVLPK